MARSPLTDDNRAYLRGEKDVDNPKQYEYRLRNGVREGIKRLPEDLRLLEENGHEDLVGEFYRRTDAVQRLRMEVIELRETIKELQAEQEGNQDETE